MKIKKGDQVKMMSGKDRGKAGAVTAVYPKELKITVEGINIYKKRVRPTKQGQKGETVMVARPFAAAKAMIVCPNCKKVSRVGFRVEGDAKAGAKIRFCKKCGANI